MINETSTRRILEVAPGQYWINTPGHPPSGPRHIMTTESVLDAAYVVPDVIERMGIDRKKFPLARVVEVVVTFREVVADGAS